MIPKKGMMESKIITDNPRESLTIEYCPYIFRVIQETKGSFPDYPKKQFIVINTKEAQELAQFIQNTILEL